MNLQKEIVSMIGTSIQNIQLRKIVDSYLD